VSVLSQSHRAARSPWIGAAGRIGLAAQGICFGLIGVLAIGLAAGVGGEATDPQGALDALARHGWARVLIVALAVGFAGYTVWRLAQAVFDRGGMGSDGPGLFRRAIQLVQGIAYGFLTWGAANVLAGATGAQKGGEKKAAAGLLGLPGGRELVGLVATVLVVTAGVLVYWALGRRVQESLAMHLDAGRHRRRPCEARTCCVRERSARRHRRRSHRLRMLRPASGEVPQGLMPS
jgi:hypothetical protein